MILSKLYIFFNLFQRIMLLHHVPVLLMLLDFTFGFPRDRTTETPDIPRIVSPKLRRPTHISEFTDPDTGLNPFLDLEEGLTSIGRNVMEDERRDDQPYFDIDLVEGDVPDRRWNLQEPKEHLDRMPVRRPEFDYKDESDFQVVTTQRILPTPLTTVELFVSKETEKLKTNVVEEEKDVQSEVEKEEKESLTVSRSTVIYATVAISVTTLIIVLVGACWWRRKLKSSRTSTTTTENGEVKS